jgi:hypothetical protein
MNFIKRLVKFILILAIASYLLGVIINLSRNTHFKLASLSTNTENRNDSLLIVARFEAKYFHHFEITDLKPDLFHPFRNLTRTPGTYCKPITSIEAIHFDQIDSLSKEVYRVRNEAKWVLNPCELAYELAGQSEIDTLISEDLKAKYFYYFFRNQDKLRPLNDFITEYNSIDSLYSDNDEIHGYGSIEYTFWILNLTKNPNSKIRTTIKLKDGTEIVNDTK